MAVATAPAITVTRLAWTDQTFEEAEARDDARPWTFSVRTGALLAGSGLAKVPDGA